MDSSGRASRLDVAAAMALGLLTLVFIAGIVTLPENFGFVLVTLFLATFLTTTPTVEQWLAKSGRHRAWWLTAFFHPAYIHFVLESRGVDARWPGSLRTLLFAVGCVAWVIGVAAENHDEWY